MTKTRAKSVRKNWFEIAETHPGSRKFELKKVFRVPEAYLPREKDIQRSGWGSKKPPLTEHLLRSNLIRQVFYSDSVTRLLIDRFLGREGTGLVKKYKNPNKALAAFVLLHPPANASWSVETARRALEQRGDPELVLKNLAPQLKPEQALLAALKPEDIAFLEKVREEMRSEKLRTNPEFKRLVERFRDERVAISVLRLEKTYGKKALGKLRERVSLRKLGEMQDKKKK